MINSLQATEIYKKIMRYALIVNVTDSIKILSREESYWRHF